MEAGKDGAIIEGMCGGFWNSVFSKEVRLLCTAIAIVTHQLEFIIVR